MYLRSSLCCRCSEAVSRIEQSALGTVFVCTFGGPKHGASGCHRTYLSQRDLQAHIDYRHLRTHHAPEPRAPPSREYAPPKSQRPAFVSEPPPGVAYHQRIVDGMQHPMQQMHPQPPLTPPTPLHAPPGMAMSAPPAHQVPPIQTAAAAAAAAAAIESYHTIPVMSSSRTNLITIPVQDENSYQHMVGSPQQGAPPGHYPPSTSNALEYIKSHPPPMSVQPPHMSVQPQPSIMTQPPPITSSVAPRAGLPPQGVLPPHFSSPQRPYVDELQQPQNMAFGQQGGMPNAHHQWPGLSAPGTTLVQGGMALQVPANSRNTQQCVAPPTGIVHNRPPNPATLLPAGMLATRPPPTGLLPQGGMPRPAGMPLPQGGMPTVGMMCGPPPQRPATSGGLGPPSQTRYYQ